jgi:hypothetical protein
MKPTSPNKKRLFWIGSAAAMAAVMYLAWHFAGSDTSRPTPAQTPTSKEVAKSENRPGPPTGATGTTMPGTVAPATQLTTVEEGDMEIDKILRSEKEIPAMARDLNGLVQKLNGEAQVNASRHLVNLTSDEDYNLISGFLVDPKMNPDVIEVLFSDLMNRKRDLQLPLFLNILKNPQHPQNEQVKNVMSILASEDFGTDYNAWEKWVNEEMEKIKKGES